MSQNISLNPFFDPDPRWYSTSLQCLCIFSTILVVQGCYTILRHTPKQVASEYSYLLMGHMFIGFAFQLNLTVLCPMLVYLPFTACEGIGLMAYLGIGIKHQIVLLCTSILAALTVVVPLFYYRMRCLLPDDHFFNWKYVHYFVNAGLYCFCCVFPPPLIYLSMNYQPQFEVKKYYEMTYNMTFPKLYSSQVIAVILAGNPWAVLCSLGVFGACAAVAGVIVVCSYFSYSSLKKTSISLSISTKKHHINLLKSLIAMILVLGSVISMIIPIMACFMIFNSLRTDIMNILIVLSATAYPATIITYALNYTPYRQFHLKIFRRLFGLSIYPASPHISVINSVLSQYRDPKSK